MSTTPGWGDRLGAALVGLVVFLGAYVALVPVAQLFGHDLWLPAFAVALVLSLTAAQWQLRRPERH